MLFGRSKIVKISRPDPEVTLKKLGMVTALEYFLDEKEAQQLSAALQKKHEPR